MKKLILAAALICLSVSSNAQITMQDSNNILTFKKSSDFNDAQTLGSKYFSETFIPTKVNQGTQDFQIRYNAFTDVMEYNNGKDVLDLIKDKNVHFSFLTGEVYELLTYTTKEGSVSHYHQILVNGNNSKVSKFRSIKLVPASKAANSYEEDKPASYKNNNDVYFVTYNNQTIEFDGKSKDLEKLIPSKAAEIKQFFKENKIKENDTDMIKLGNFLSKL